MLRINIYDFAIYVDSQTLHRTKLSSSLRRPLWRWHRGSRTPTELFQQVVTNHDVEMSLTVRPSRDLPLVLMASEYKRILRKRMKVLGGNPNDEALTTLLQYFDADKLPPKATRRGCIRKDTTLHFCRTKNGVLTAVANGTLLTSVHSRKLCEAVFDLYLGDAPVSKKARATAGQTMLEMITNPPVAQA